MKGGEALDAELQSLVAVGAPLGASLVILGAVGAALFETRPAVLVLSVCLGLGLLVASLASLAFAPAYDVGIAMWAIVSAMSLLATRQLFATHPGSIIGSLIPCLVVAFALVRRRPMRARIRGDERIALGALVGLESTDLAHCCRCGEPAHAVVAPRWSISFVFGGMVNYGSFRPLCLRHARLYALPATLVSLAFGWWSIVGLINTPAVLADNLVHGGLEAEAADVELRARIGWRAALPTVAAVFGTFFGMAEASFLFFPLLP